MSGDIVMTVAIQNARSYTTVPGYTDSKHITTFTTLNQIEPSLNCVDHT